MASTQTAARKRDNCSCPAAPWDPPPHPTGSHPQQVVGEQADGVARLRSCMLDEQQHVDHQAQRAQQGRHAQQGQQDLGVDKGRHHGCCCVQTGVQPGSPGLQLAEGGCAS